MSIQSKGGKARAASMSAAERSEQAANAANARWSGVPRQAFVIECASAKAPDCMKQVTVVAANETQAQRTIIKLNWNILHDHEQVYGYMCHACVKAHGKVNTEV